LEEEHRGSDGSGGGVYMFGRLVEGRAHPLYSTGWYQGLGFRLSTPQVGIQSILHLISHRHRTPPRRSSCHVALLPTLRPALSPTHSLTPFLFPPIAIAPLPHHTQSLLYSLTHSLTHSLSLTQTLPSIPPSLPPPPPSPFLPSPSPPPPPPPYPPPPL